MIQFEPGPEFKVDTSGLMNKLGSFLNVIIDEAADQLVDSMKRHSSEASSIGPGDPNWRAEIDRYIVKLDKTTGRKSMTATVGARGISDAELTKIMLIAEGGGSRGLYHTPIRFGPEGRMVWNDDLTGRHASSGRRNGPAPDRWNHEGNKFPEKAMDELENNFDSIANRAGQHISAVRLEGVIYQ